MAVIRTTSHRSRQRLAQVIKNLGREHYTWGKSWPVSGYYVVADADLPAATSITGVSEIKRSSTLHPCIVL